MNNSIIGILGTLLGTLLGWILGRYDKIYFAFKKQMILSGGKYVTRTDNRI